MSADEAALIAPLVIVAAWGLLVPLAGRVVGDAARWLALAGLGLAGLAAATLVWRAELVAGVELLGGALVADRLGLLLDGAIVVALAAIVAAAPRPGAAGRDALVLLAGAGGGIL